MDRLLIVCLLGYMSTAFGCQDGWESYNGHCYKLFGTASRSSAAEGCRNEGAYLACVENQEENTFIADVAGSQRAFLGHIDEGSEGVWRCNNEAATIAPVWWRGEPNNCCGGENCAEINFGERGKWNDCGCGARFQSVCEKEGSCEEDGWVHHEGHCYLRVVSSLNFDEAEQNCVASSSHLVCIDSQSENSFISGLAEGGRAWIGHTDNGHEGVWMCIGEDGSEVTPWRTASNEPNNCCSGENCAEINFGGTGLWNDLSCSGSLPYVCEKEDEVETEAVNCEAGWTLHDNKCYKVFPSADYASANQQCNEVSANVVCIDNSIENAFIADLTGGTRTFIGHIDSVAEGIWRCEAESTNMEPVWWGGEPNNCCGGENCAEINFGARGKWNDCGCGASFGYVCEKLGPCDDGWRELNGHCYKYVTTGENWNNAKDACIGIDAHLVCIDSIEENNLVADISNGARSWIGHIDIGHEGAWMCTAEDGYEASWWNGEPNNVGSGGENCAEINFGERSRWNDVGCGASFQFVCEKTSGIDINDCDFVANFFSHCTTDSQDECSTLLAEMAQLNDEGCDKVREFMSGMTGLCALE